MVGISLRELKENYIKYIDKSILDYNRILDNQSRIKLDYDSILDTLRSVYSEFFI